MGEQYFLGANSRAGFQSLYRYFAAAGALREAAAEEMDAALTARLA